MTTKKATAIDAEKGHGDDEKERSEEKHSQTAGEKETWDARGNAEMNHRNTDKAVPKNTDEPAKDRKVEYCRRSSALQLRVQQIHL